MKLNLLRSFSSMQLYSFLSDSRIEQPFGEALMVGDIALQARRSLIQAQDHFDCTKCNWRSGGGGSHRVTLPKDDVLPAHSGAGTKASLHSLNDDALLVLISHLDTPSLLAFSKAYYKVANLVKVTDVSCFSRDRNSSFI